MRDWWLKRLMLPELKRVGSHLISAAIAPGHVWCTVFVGQRARVLFVFAVATVFCRSSGGDVCDGGSGSCGGGGGGARSRRRQLLLVVRLLLLVLLLMVVVVMVLQMLVAADRRSGGAVVTAAVGRLDVSAKSVHSAVRIGLAVSAHAARSTTVRRVGQGHGSGGAAVALLVRGQAPVVRER